MEQQTKWYPVEYDGYWGIMDKPAGEEGKDQLAAVHVGEGQAEYNAKLCAMAPKLLEAIKLIQKHYPKAIMIDQMGGDYDIIEELIKKLS